MKKHWILLAAATLLVLGVILNAIYGGLFSTGTYSLNYFSCGDYAIGIFAVGNFAIGIFSAGIFSIGIFSISIFNVSLYAVGIFVYAWKKRAPKLLNNQQEESLNSQV